MIELMFEFESNAILAIRREFEIKRTFWVLH